MNPFKQKLIEEAMDKVVSSLIAFEELTPEEKKPSERAKMILALMSETISHTINTTIEEAKKELEGMKKGECFVEMRTPQDVNYWYNQALTEAISKLDELKK